LLDHHAKARDDVKSVTSVSIFLSVAREDTGIVAICRVLRSRMSTATKLGWNFVRIQIQRLKLVEAGDVIIVFIRADRIEVYQDHSARFVLKISLTGLSEQSHRGAKIRCHAEAEERNCTSM
jgi:hypothetical protein